MEKRRVNLSDILKKKLIVIIVFMILILLFLTIFLFYLNKNKTDSVLVNIFGKQRMFSQMMAKDANRKYAILLSLEQGPLVSSSDTLRNRIVGINTSLMSTRKQFSDTLMSLNKGMLQHDGNSFDFKESLDKLAPTLSEINALWRNFDQSLLVIANTTKIDVNAAQALAFINLNNQKLMNLSDQINLVMLQDQAKASQQLLLLSLILLLCVIVLFFGFIYEFLKYMFLPLNEIYKEIFSLGLFKLHRSTTPTRHDIIPVIKEINAGMGKLNKMMELLTYINRDISFDETLTYIYNSFSSFIPYKHIGIALLLEDGKTLEASYGISDSSLGDLSQKMLGLRSEMSKTSLMSIVSSGKPRIINDLEHFTKNLDAEYNKVLLGAGVKSSISLPLKINNELIGIIFFSCTEPNAYNEEHVMFLSSLADSITISFNKNIFIDELIYSNVLALAKMAEARDEDTGEHLDRMKEYSKLIAELLAEEHVYDDQISIRFIKDIERYSPMHDIGKVGIRDGILLKPGKLTVEEFKEMKKHTLYGAEVLRTEEKNINKKNRSLFNVGIEIAEGHHEKWNGSGYPHGKKGEDIPLSARIVAMADVFDALTSKRPYKNAFSFEESFQMIVEGRGQHFDPNIVDVFVKHKARILALYESFQNESLSA